MNMKNVINKTSVNDLREFSLENYYKRIDFTK